MSSELADPDVEPGQRGGVAESTAELRDYCVLVARQYGAAQAAEDVAQDAMMAYLAAAGVEQPRAWLRTVVRRLVSQRFRDPHRSWSRSVPGAKRTSSSKVPGWTPAGSAMYRPRARKPLLE